MIFSLPSLNAYQRRWQTFNQGVAHATFDPKGPGAVRLHLVPPKPALFHDPDSLLVINGYYFVNMGPAWALLLRSFLQHLTDLCPTNREISEEEVSLIEEKTIRSVKVHYPKADAEKIHEDLHDIVGLAVAVAQGKELPAELFDGLTMDKYFRHANAPQRMDLIVSPMILNGKRRCQLDCGACYAQCQPAMDIQEELSTDQWKQIIDKCREAMIPMVTFTGGEPLTRHDIVELVAYSEWFVTRINTNGYALTYELAQQLYEASLDGIQITLYSSNPEIHDELVGKKGAWKNTVQGIKNALKAGLEVSVNTPLLKINSNYSDTLRFLNSLGVHCVTCSGLIPAGGAKEEIGSGKSLKKEELLVVLSGAMSVRKELAMDLGFTSPGWLTPEETKQLGLPSCPVCGACASNMAVAPNGDVVPCQSWLNGNKAGNMLKDTWSSIWRSKVARNIRKNHFGNGYCPLKEKL